ncbi:hypothetical protein SAMN05421505_12066 [Sinosporangium album]|uniref:Peptidase inhibitor I78 family protein n=1 Tax=Sinosporangium album TaxID=504805 RepID=A0A1G8EEK3_9ACTN|nr:DUF4258 domain-containing protein [Sinosporangium album]SDH68326.1 hypothetical protein SAMN05421505_12066 [Sinosporangium album]
MLKRAALGLLIPLLIAGTAVAAPPATASDQHIAASAVADKPRPPRGKPSNDGCGQRPTYIAGYTTHARQRLAEHRIGEDQVQALVADRNARTRPGHTPCTWRLSNGRIWAVINDRAGIVTVGPGS